MKIEKENQTHITAIIVDITNVLFLINMMGILRSVGILNVLWYVLTTWKNPETTCLEFLDTLQKHSTQQYPIISYKNYHMPDCITANIIGRATTEQVCTEINKAVHDFSAQGYFKNKQEEQMVRDLIDIMFNLARIKQTLQPNKPLIELLQSIKNRSDRYQFFLLTNVGKDTYQALTQQYPEVFALFDGAIISGQVGELKPYPAIYQMLLNTYNLDPHACVFIDDQEDNIATARELGFNTIVYQNCSRTKKELAKLGVDV